MDYVNMTMSHLFKNNKDKNLNQNQQGINSKQAKYIFFSLYEGKTRKSFLKDILSATYFQDFKNQQKFAKKNVQQTSKYKNMTCDLWNL